MATLENLYVPLNNLDLLDEAGTLNPYTSGEYRFDESPEDLTLDEIYAGASEEELYKLTHEVFLDTDKFYYSLPSHKTHEQLKRRNQFNDQAIAENALRFVTWFVRKKRNFPTHRLSLLDRIQNANLHLVARASEYDEERGASFINFIATGLARALDRAEHSGNGITSPLPIMQGDMIRIPNANSPYHKIRDFIEGSRALFGRQLEDDEIAELCNFSENDLKSYREHHIDYISFHRLLNEYGEPVEQPLERLHDQITQSNTYSYAAHFIDLSEIYTSLKANERLTLSLRLKIPVLLSEAERNMVNRSLEKDNAGSDKAVTYRDIAQILGSSPQTPLNLFNRAVKKLGNIPAIRNAIEESMS